jgi:3-phenylpropionate/cinnamic acid dioxygenase small subunit
MNVADSIKIHELMSHYAYALDEHRMDLLEDCFTPEASFTIDIHGAPSVGPFVGRAAIMNLMRDAAAAQTDRRRHVVTNVFIERAGDGEADVVSNLTLFSIAHARLNALTTGVYRDHVTRATDRWFIHQRHLHLDLPY